MKNQDFIITSLQNWDIEIGSTVKNIALEMSKKNRVIYLNTPMDYTTWLRGDTKTSYTHRMDVIKGRTPDVRQINKNMWVIDCPFIVYPVNSIPTSFLFDFVNKLNNKKIASRILKAVKELGFSDYIHFIDTDIYRSFYMKELLKPALSIYYCRDFVVGMDYWKKNGARLEPMLAAKSDMVITNSSFFAQRFRPLNDKTYSVGTGVDLSLYDASAHWEIPDDVKPVKRPVIGYIGAIFSNRLDSDLIFRIAQERPEYSFVMVGPEDDVFAHHAIHQLPNVIFLGKKAISSLPAYINSFDVCLNFQIVNDITNGNYPLKIDEYLAMGKPVVATKTHTMCEFFSEHTYLPSNKEEYLSAIDSALQEAGDEKLKEKRIRFAHTHTWENAVDKIYRYIQSVLDNPD